MIYWVIETQEHGIQLNLEPETLLGATIKDGLNPATVRAALSSDGAPKFHFTPHVKGIEIDEAFYDSLPDCLYWGWVPIFSQRATEVLLSHGSLRDDFLECNIHRHRNLKCNMYLPKDVYDIMDFSKSKFAINIPTVPHILQRLTHAEFSRSPIGLPSVFRVSSLLPGQVLDDLLVDDKCKLAWESKSFSGINFRKV